MNDRPKSVSPPYATFSTFLSFLNKLDETGIPSRIDPTVFGNASGSAYSIIAALKFLKLIEESGAPTPNMLALVKAPEDTKPAVLKEVIQKGYPSLFKADANLGTMTAGQFDEHMRSEYGVQGSTVDKIAAFFIAACKMAGLPLSPHLIARKAIAVSSSAKKSLKQRKRDGEETRDDADADEAPTPAPATAKALEYQLIDLMSEPGIDEEVKQSIWALVQYLMARKAKQAATGEE